MKKLVAHQSQLEKEGDGSEEDITMERNTKKGSKSSPRV